MRPRDMLDEVISKNDPIQQGFTHRSVREEKPRLKTEGNLKHISQFSTNPVITEIESSKQFFKNRRDILDRVLDLQRMQLLKPRPVNLKALKPNQSRGYTMNDYHERQTNPGYSRNKTGGFYTS